MQSSAPPSGQRDESWNQVRNALLCLAPYCFTDQESPAVIRAFNQVHVVETAEAFEYRMNGPWLQLDELRVVEIRWGNALWVIGHRDGPIKVKLRRNHEMRLSNATASMSIDSMLTVVIPKWLRPRKWYEYKDLTFNKFQTVHVGISLP